jgi:hypothetical protein
VWRYTDTALSYWIVWCLIKPRNSTSLNEWRKVGIFVRMEEWRKEVQRFSRILHFIGEDKYWRLFFHQTPEPYVHKMHVELSSVFKYSQHTSWHLLLLRCVRVSFLQNAEDHCLSVTLSHAGRPESSATQLWEPKISQMYRNLLVII